MLIAKLSRLFSLVYPGILSHISYMIAEGIVSFLQCEKLSVSVSKLNMVISSAISQRFCSNFVCNISSSQMGSKKNCINTVQSNMNYVGKGFNQKAKGGDVGVIVSIW